MGSGGDDKTAAPTQPASLSSPIDTSEINPTDLVDPRWYLKQLGRIAGSLTADAEKASVDKTLALFEKAVAALVKRADQDDEISDLADAVGEAIADLKIALASDTPGRVQKMQKIYTDMYTHVTGQELSEAGRDLREPIDRLGDMSILEMHEGQIEQVVESILSIPGLDEQKKKRWLRCCKLAIAVQHLARSCNEAMWVYVGRDWENGRICTMGDIHHSFFSVWDDPERRHKLIEAPPGHGKSHNFVGKMVWDVANDSTLRCLVLGANEDFAKRVTGQLKKVFRSKLLKALYPAIRVLGRSDDEEDSSKRFTIARENLFSREPTFEAHGILSGVNGRGYDHVYIDDPMNPNSVHQPSHRKAVNDAFENVIEERLRNPARAHMYIVCTPWHPDDLAGRIVRKVGEGKRPEWQVAIRQFAVKSDADGRPISLWPQRYDTAYYEAKRATKTIVQWRRLFELVDLPDEQRVVSKLHYYPESVENTPDWKRLSDGFRKRCRDRLHAINNAEQWLSIDPSGTANTHSSKIGVIHFALTAQGKAYVVRAWEHPGSPAAVQQWLVACLSGGHWPNEASEETRMWSRPDRVDKLLVEWAGGPVMGVSLWEDYIERTLREINPKLCAKIIRAAIHPKGGGQNRGKTLRLSDSAAYLENPYVMLPGRLVVDAKAKQMSFECSDRTDIVTLSSQILDHPAAGTDLTDSMTQFIREVEPRFRTDKSIKDSDRARHAGARSVNPRTAKLIALRQRLMKTSGTPGAKSAQEEENGWLELQTAS